MQKGSYILPVSYSFEDWVQKCTSILFKFYLILEFSETTVIVLALYGFAEIMVYDKYIGVSIHGADSS